MKHHNCLAQLLAGFCFGLFACSSLSAQVEFDNPFHSVLSASFGHGTPVGNRNSIRTGEYYHFNATLYYDYVGLSLGVEQTNNPEGAGSTSRLKSTAVMAGLSGAIPLGKGRWRSWLDVQCSFIGGVRGVSRYQLPENNNPYRQSDWYEGAVYSRAAFGYGAQLRLPVIRDKFYLCLRLNRVDVRGKTPFDTLNYGLGLAYEHRAKPLK